jgi:hypothetical protein
MIFFWGASPCSEDLNVACDKIIHLMGWVVKVCGVAPPPPAPAGPLKFYPKLRLYAVYGQNISKKSTLQLGNGFITHPIRPQQQQAIGVY